MEPPTLQHAVGSTLGEFEPLLSAEKVLLDACRQGLVAKIGESRPEAASESNSIRASFIRFLLIADDPLAPVHAGGVGARGAWLNGDLDLDGVVSERRLLLANCHIDHISAHDARLRGLFLPSSMLKGGINAHRIRVFGSVMLGDSFIARETVNLIGAEIAGDLECRGGEFFSQLGVAIMADRVKVIGGVFLHQGFSAAGVVRLAGADIGGQLNCRGGRFFSRIGDALMADGVKVAGNIFLHQGFTASGAVRLVGANVGGQIVCRNAKFVATEHAALLLDMTHVGSNVILDDGFIAEGAVGLSQLRVQGDLCCEGGKIDGDIQAQSLQVGGRLQVKGLTVAGNINLAGSHVRILSDNPAFWQTARGKLRLDGFTCDRLDDGAPTDAKSRIDWLDAQVPEHLAIDFRPQPWEQLIAVLRAMGHPNEARRVAIAKQQRERRAGRHGAWWNPRRWAHAIYGELIGYGYQPMRLVGIAGVVWLLCALAYHEAAWPTLQPERLLAPAGAGPGNACLARLIRDPRDTCARTAPNVATFNPWVYSLDVLLPVVNLGYKAEWKPRVADEAGRPLAWGLRLRLLYWFEIAFGWLAGLLLVSVLGGLVKKD